MKKIGLSAAVVLLFFAMGYFAFKQPSNQELHLTSITSFHDVQNVLNRLGPDDIVFFDVDDTLLTENDYLPSPYVVQTLFKTLAVVRYPRLRQREYSEHVFSAMLQQAPRFLTEQSVTGIIHKLRQQGTRVMVITGMESGAFGDIASMSAWRSEMLEQFGVSLSREFVNTTFDTFPSYRGNYPCLYNGLICCNQRSKGEVIDAFLKHFNLKPAIMVHFDDIPEELVSSRAVCLKQGIAPLCFHYQGAAKIKHLPWSTRRAFAQLNKLLLDGRWISDEEAEAASQIKWINIFF